ncbi:hypothetical protein BT63DRAFT_277410 [Microthyrium microscopicum]|uniref:Uncharacterized protein n=1 Tax=Microthyrium microscopicum TaxID=703497 RepID=A0A6A6U862_9PEZI|nr:hypothetical protein BT63DRAFT_277410 [Microthyrium microscopicum]
MRIHVIARQIGGDTRFMAWNHNRDSLVHTICKKPFISCFCCLFCVFCTPSSPSRVHKHILLSRHQTACIPLPRCRTSQRHFLCSNLRQLWGLHEVCSERKFDQSVCLFLHVLHV